MFHLGCLGLKWPFWATTTLCSSASDSFGPVDLASSCIYSLWNTAQAGKCLSTQNQWRQNNWQHSRAVLRAFLRSWQWTCASCLILSRSRRRRKKASRLSLSTVASPSILFFISAMAHGSSLSQHASSQCWQTISSSTSSCNIDLDLWPTPQRLTRDFGRSAEVSKAARSLSDVDFCGFPHVTCRLTYRVFFNWFIKVVSACWSWKKLVSPQYVFIVLGDQFIVIYSIGETSFFQPQYAETSFFHPQHAETNF